MHKNTRAKLCDILDDSVLFYKKYWCCLFMLPLMTVIASLIGDYITQGQSDETGGGLLLFAVMLLVHLFNTCCYAGLALQVNGYLQGNAMSASNGFLAGGGSLLRLIFAQLLVFLSAMALLAIPFAMGLLFSGNPILVAITSTIAGVFFIVLFLRLSFYPLTILLDNKGVFSGYSYSLKLTKGLRSLVILLVIYSVMPLVSFVMIILPNACFAFIGYLATHFIGMNFAGMSEHVELIFNALFWLTYAFVTPLALSASIYMYYSFREKLQAREVSLST